MENVKQWTFAPGARPGALVYRFEIDDAPCNDDSHSLFRFKRPHLAVISACSGPGRHQPVFRASGSVSLESAGKGPAYPQIAQSARVSGVVIVELSIERAGTVTAARVLNDVPLLAPAVADYAKTLRVRTPAPPRAIVVYEFVLDHEGCQDNRFGATIFYHVNGDYWRVGTCPQAIQDTTSATDTR